VIDAEEEKSEVAKLDLDMMGIFSPILEALFQA
jgi:hypothetical protein